MSIIETLRARGLVEQISNEPAIRELLDGEKTSAYVGFDPTATSLHLGNLVPIMVLAHLQRAGHRPIAVVGGATGRIGDPSGKDAERQLLDEATIRANLDGIGAQLRSFLDFEGDDAALLVDNYDWIGPMGYIEWLREVGKYFSVNYMIAKESVKRRLEQREQGISYTEFSYMMLQAFDFAHLYANEGCRLQIGGNDQWGNITAGIDLVHKKHQGTVFGMTVPLITTASGEKFGKSAGNAVWLDPEMTSPYQFYQYWMQTDDRDVARWFKLFTFLDIAEIQEIVAAHEADPGRRTGQKRLAAEITRVVHGEAGLAAAEKATSILFGGEIADLTDAELKGIFADVPSSERPRADLDAGIGVIDLFGETLCKSRGEARRLMKQGGVNVNNRRVSDADATLGVDDLATETSLVLRAGKKKYHVVRFV